MGNLFDVDDSDWPDQQQQGPPAGTGGEPAGPFAHIAPEQDQTIEWDGDPDYVDEPAPESFGQQDVATPPQAAPQTPAPTPSEGAAAPPEGALTPEQYAERWVGEGRKYADPNQLAQGYENALQMADRQAQARAAAEQRAARLEQMLANAAAMIQQPAPAPAAGPTGPDPRLLAEAERLGMEPEQVQLMSRVASQMSAEQMAEFQRRWAAEQSRVADLDRQRYEEAEQQRQLEAGLNEIQTFRMRHQAELAADPQLENKIEAAWNRVMQPFAEADWVIPTADNLALMAEAVANPQLFEVIEAVPDFLETPGGMALARRLAQTGTPGPTRPTSNGGAPPARMPRIETGGRGPAPASEQGPSDRWAVLDLVDAEKKTRSSPLGI